ncbi:MAG: YggT family protein [Eubacteriales bacterium]
MELFLVLTVNFVDLLLGVLLIAMLLRALMSIFLMGDENTFSIFLYYFTEPFIMPVRRIFEKLGWFEGLPIDMSFFVTTILIGMIQTLLYAIPM